MLSRSDKLVHAAFAERNRQDVFQFFFEVVRVEHGVFGKLLQTSAAERPEVEVTSQQNSDVADFLAPLVQAVESTSITNLYLNKIVAGELSIEDGLNKAADELHSMVTKAGLKSSKLPPL